MGNRPEDVHAKIPPFERKKGCRSPFIIRFSVGLNFLARRCLLGLKIFLKTMSIYEQDNFHTWACGGDGGMTPPRRPKFSDPPPCFWKNFQNLFNENFDDGVDDGVDDGEITLISGIDPKTE